MARTTDPAAAQATNNPATVDGTRPDQQPPSLQPGQAVEPGAEPEVDKQYWMQCLNDAERAEQNWRQRGRVIVQIYRNQSTNNPYANWWPWGGSPGGNRRSNQYTGITYNILYANTEVMLPAIYMQPPQPVVRARFSQPSPGPVAPPMMPPPPPGAPIMLPPGAAALPPPGLEPPPPAGSPLSPANGNSPGPEGPPIGAPMPIGPALGPSPEPGPGALPLPAGIVPPVPAQPGPPPVLPGMPPAGGGPGAHMMPDSSMMAGPPMPPPGPVTPPPNAIDTAAAVIEKALEIVVDDEHSHEAVKAAIKDVLLPGRGVCRVRWKPQMKTEALPGGPLPDGTMPTEQRKVWEEVDDEYVYWEDFLCDPVRQAADMSWIAFRHLFSAEQAKAEFTGTPDFDRLVAAGKLENLLLWTDESAAKSPPSGQQSSAMPTARTLGDYIRKMMVWEIWDRANRRIIWMCKDATGLTLRVDPDTLQLSGFYPIPVPMLAVTTSDSRVPRAFFDLYDKMAQDLDNTSVRISNLTNQVKVRGAYNGASREIADILKADDGKMIPVDGVDLMTGGLANHIWLVPIQEFMAALDKLYLAREQLKQSIYEVMGISDIMRGATKASETATAQRIKGSMGTNRLEDMRSQASNFVRDLLRLKAEVIAKNFDAETLSAMTGEDVTPEVMAILRSDFQRTCSVDIEAESTVAVDEQAEQQSMAMIMQAVQGVFTGIQPMMMMGLPAPMVMQLALEMLKLFLHPINFSRGVVELVNKMQDQLQSMPPPPPMPPPGAGPGGPPPGPGGPPPKRVSMPNGAPPVVPGGPMI